MESLWRFTLESWLGAAVEHLVGVQGAKLKKDLFLHSSIYSFIAYTNGKTDAAS